jgi:hypothetical protein
VYAALRTSAQNAGKKLNVLSFGDEAEEGEEEGKEVRYRSAHEVLREDAKLQQAEVGVHDEHVEQLQQRLAQEQVSSAVSSADERCSECCRESRSAL